MRLLDIKLKFSYLKHNGLVMESSGCWLKFKYYDIVFCS